MGLSWAKEFMLKPSLSFGSQGNLFKRNKSGSADTQRFEWIWRFWEYWPEFLIFTFAVAASVTCFWLLRAAKYNSADNTFYQQASDRATVLVWELDRVLGDLQTVTAFMSISFDWKEDSMRERFKNLTAGILNRSPGTQGLTWVPIVTDPAERAFLEVQEGYQLNLGGPPSETRLTSSGQIVRCIYYKDAAGNSICSPPTPTGGPFRPEGSSSDHAFYPVYFLEPVNDPTGFRSSNAPAIMYDLSSNPPRNLSLSKAIITDSSSATSRLLLVQETESQYSMIVFNPVHQFCRAQARPTAPAGRLSGSQTPCFASPISSSSHRRASYPWTSEYEETSFCWTWAASRWHRGTSAPNYFSRAPTATSTRITRNISEWTSSTPV